MSDPIGQGPFCQHCKKRRCSRRSRIWVQVKGGGRYWVWVCSKCIYNSMEKIREWIVRLEAGERP